MKGILKLIPRNVWERIKLLYYNSNQQDYKFSFKKKLYGTMTKSWSICTNTPLYFLTKQIERYEQFYKIKPTDNIIDAGAFDGILSLVYAEKAKHGRIFSFEPDQYNIEKINGNFKLNISVNNIQLRNKGLWSKTGKIKFFEDGSVASSSFYKAKNSIEKIIQVIALDDFVEENKIEKIDFIKMDVEGAELEILKGAKKMLSQLKPNLSIATYHLVEGELTYTSVENFFRETNYPYKTVFFEDGEIITYAGPAVEKIIQ
ncbi:FkbM family methyltransferase [Christiangramia aquimixticola]|uniref:FkbM family methyltransferase n=1 Tax=Christiangramia aquimixticola TaxID=1697558 RepID=UPI003AA7E3E6